MCQHGHAHSPKPPARAVSLADGRAHDEDHAAWSRRDFLVRAGLGAAAGTVALGSTTVRAMSRSPLFRALATTETDRALVLIQLIGGNDGLNTIVPVGNDLYHNARPTLALGTADTVELDAGHRLHSALAPLAAAYHGGELAVVQGVGYGAPSLSHFRSTDIWMSASESDELVTTGWTGRLLQHQFPDFLETPPDAPPAVQIGTTAPLLFAGDGAGYGMAMLDIDNFLAIADGGEVYDTDNVPSTVAGGELAFVRTVANDAFRYRDAIYAATETGTNDVEYPDTDLGRELAAVARLIKGRLDTRVYHVALGGFDTHADQLDRHALLLEELGGALAAFYADLHASEDDERTLAMTFSEFGRRVAENGSDGTDHGTAAPVLMMGPAAVGGFYGQAPDLSALDETGNVDHAVDFRQVYATVLQHWFGLGAQESADVLGIAYDPLAMLTPPVAGGAQPGSPALTVETPTPNPVRDRARIAYRVPAAGDASLVLFDVVGRRIAVLADGAHAAGTHSVDLDAGALPSGVYVVRLRSGGATASRRLTVAR